MSKNMMERTLSRRPNLLVFQVECHSKKGPTLGAHPGDHGALNACDDGYMGGMVTAQRNGLFCLTFAS